MNTYHHSTTRAVMLSQSQASLLLHFFDESLRHVNDRAHDFTEINQRLSDSFWLARWLRKNVSLELRAEEIIDLSEALIDIVDEHPWSDDECQTLRAIVDQLSSMNSAPVKAAPFLAKPSPVAIPSHCCEV